MTKCDFASDYHVQGTKIQVLGSTALPASDFGNRDTNGNNPAQGWRTEDVNVDWLWKIATGWSGRTFFAIAQVTRIFPDAFCLISKWFDRVWITKILSPLNLPDLVDILPRSLAGFKKITEKNSPIEFDVVSLLIVGPDRWITSRQNMELRATAPLISHLRGESDDWYEWEYETKDLPDDYPVLYEEIA